MKKLFKITALAVSLMMVFSLIGCAGEVKESTTASSASVTTTAATTAAPTEAEIGTKDPKVLVMRTNAAFPPIEYPEGDGIVGVDAEMMELIAQELGVELEIVDMEFDALPTALANGQIDIIAAGFTVTPDREEAMDFTTPYYTAAQTVIVLKDSGYTGIADLEGKLIGVQTGTTGSFCAEDIVDDPDNDIKGFASGMLAVEALKNGQVDAVIIDNNPAKEYAESNADLVLIEGEFADEKYAMAVAKGNDVLLGNVNAALAAIKDNGEFDKIVDKYIK